MPTRSVRPTHSTGCKMAKLTKAWVEGNEHGIRPERKYPLRMKIEGIPADVLKSNGYPWKNGDIVCLLGEIVKMAGHYVVVGPDHKVYFGYHDDFMVELDKDE